MRHAGRRSVLQRTQRAGYEQIRSDRRYAYEYLATEDDHWHAAFDARRSLAETGPHRAVGMADLFTAVLAGEPRLTLVHDDTDVDAAGEMIGFTGWWVSPRGSLP